MWQEEPPRTEEVYGVAPEIIEEAVGSVVDKISKLSSTLRVASEVRFMLSSSGELKKVSPAGDYCYLSIDSSYTSPPLELVGGYLSLIFVVSAMYGTKCYPRASGPEISAYVTYDPTRDLTRLEARKFEREKAVEALRRKVRGEIQFDILVLDGEVVPRLSPRLLSGKSTESENARRLVDITDTMVLLSESTGTPLVGVLKRSYSKDALAVLGHFLDVHLSDRAFMTYVLEPGEFFIVGSYGEIVRAYRNLVLAYGSTQSRQLSPAKYRLAWLEWMLSNSKTASRMRMAFYRPSSSISSAAVKIEYNPCALSEEDLVSALVSTSEATGFPAPVDYADSLSQIPGDVKFTLYQLVLQKIAEANPEVAHRLFSLVNPQKLGSIGLRT